MAIQTVWGMYYLRAVLLSKNGDTPILGVKVYLVVDDGEDILVATSNMYCARIPYLLYGSKIKFVKNGFTFHVWHSSSPLEDDIYEFNAPVEEGFQIRGNTNGNLYLLINAE